MAPREEVDREGQVLKNVFREARMEFQSSSFPGVTALNGPSG